MGNYDVSTTKFMEVHSPGQEMPCLTWNKNPQLVLSVCQLNPVHSLTPCLSSICYLSVIWTSTMFYSGLPINILYVFISFLMRVACPAHPSVFDLHNSVKCANYKYPPFSCCFLSLRFNKSPQPYCQTFAVCIFLQCVQGKVTHPW